MKNKQSTNNFFDHSKLLHTPLHLHVGHPVGQCSRFIEQISYLALGQQGRLIQVEYDKIRC